MIESARYRSVLLAFIPSLLGCSFAPLRRTNRHGRFSGGASTIVLWVRKGALRGSGTAQCARTPGSRVRQGRHRCGARRRPCRDRVREGPRRPRASRTSRAWRARLRGDGLDGGGARHPAALGLRPTLRMVGERPFVTDNGNVLVDCAVEPIGDPPGLERTLRAIPGVVDTGLFLGTADTVLVADGTSVNEWSRQR